MDNKITKKRLNHVFSYEWVAMIFVTVAIVFLWELCYSFFSVKLTPGQRYRIFYDYNIDDNQADAFLDVLEMNDTFSYDVLEVKFEQVLKQSSVLYNRNQLGITDAIVTDIYNSNGQSFDTPHYRAAEIIDEYKMYSYDGLLSKAQNYVDSFKTSGILDDAKLRSIFCARMKNDNRFRTPEQIETGINLERARIEKLEQDILTVNKLFEYDEQRQLDGKESVFYSYRRYSQTVAEETNPTYKEYYEELMESESVENYGLKTWLLSGGEKNTSNYFRFIFPDRVTSENVVVMIFDVSDFQKDLEYENVSMLATLIRKFSSIAG